MTKLTLTDIERFWNKVNKTESCWLWTASTRSGYGAFRLNGSVYDAHRISWQMVFGEIPAKLDICHKCDIRNCVNPEHLFLGSRSDNMEDASNKGRLVSSKRKLDNNQIEEIKKLHKDGMMQVDIAAKFHVSKGKIWDILNNRIYRN